MTPQQYVEHLEALIASGRDQEALDFAEQVGPAPLWQLSADDFERVTAMMEGAQMAVSAAQARGISPAG
jgi:hypothetical protein